MAEPTLSLKYEHLMNAVSGFLGWGENYTVLSTGNLARVEEVVQSGYRQFLNPVQEGGEAGLRPYIWSFLLPEASIGVTQAGETLDLPDDFGGGLTFLNYFAGTLQGKIPVISWEQLRALEANTLSSFSDYPKFAAIVPIHVHATDEGQRFQLRLWPILKAVTGTIYFRFRYRINPNELTVSDPYPHGGATHSETILQSCLAIAEVRVEEAPGAQMQLYQRRLQESIAADLSLKRETDEMGSWPVGETPTTLEEGYWDFLRTLGMELGFGANPHIYTHEQLQLCLSLLAQAERMFYYPPPLPTGDKGLPGRPHLWSFLRPLQSLGVVNAQAVYELPANFTGDVDAFTY